MRKNVSILIHLILSGLVFFYPAYSEDVKVNADGGTRFSFPQVIGFSGAFYGSYDNSKNKIPYSYGAGIWTDTLVPGISLEMKAGQLSITDELSVLNNPALYAAASAFYSGKKNVQKLKAAIPSSVSSASKPNAFWSSIGFSKNHGDGAFFITEEGSLGLSAGYSFDLFSKNKIQFHFLGASSWNDETKSDSWYNKNPFYPQDRTTSFSAQSLLFLEPFAIWMCYVLYSDPMGNFNGMYRGEITAPHFSLSAFFNPNHNIKTIGGKTYNEIFQIKGNVHKQMKTGVKIPVLWKFGSGFFYQANLFDTSDVLKISFSAGLLNYITSLNFQVKGDFENDISKENAFILELQKFSVSFVNKWYFSSLNPGWKMAFSMEPSGSSGFWKFSETAGMDFDIPVKPSIIFDASVKFLQDKGRFKGGEISSYLKTKYKTGNISISIKIGMSIEF